MVPNIFFNLKVTFFSFQEEAEIHKVKFEAVIDAEVQTEDHYESSEADPRSSRESALQHPQPKRAPRGRGRQTKAPAVAKKITGTTTTRGGRARGRKQTVSELPVKIPDNVPQFDDSEEENAWSERLAKDLTNIQISGFASGSLAIPGTATGTDLQFATTEEETENEEPEEKTTNKTRRRGRGVTAKKRTTVATESGVEPAGSNRHSGGFRKLAPLSETIQFLDIDGNTQPTPRPRRNLRPRK